MSREIIELVHELERDRGIEGDTLIAALEDALLAAYKKTPGASRHAVVELDRSEGDFRVFSIELPPDIEERLMDEARERVLTELEQAEAENGERSHVLVTDEDLDIDWSDVPDEQVKREDVTPENFGRIAAQTAKQVITQRIREAERQIMYDEYVRALAVLGLGLLELGEHALTRLLHQPLLDVGGQLDREHPEVALDRVELDRRVARGLRRLLVGGEERILERMDQRVAVDALLPLDRPY